MTAPVRAAQSGFRLLDAAAVAAGCSPAQAVDAVEAALAGGLDPARGVPRTAVPLAHGQLLLMPSEVGGHAGVKVTTVAPGNPSLGLPRIQAAYLVFDDRTLTLQAVLDGAALTTLRTPAVSVSAVRRRLLAGAAGAPADRPVGLRVVVFGAGPQAVGHVRTLHASLPEVGGVTRVRYVVRTPQRAAGPPADVAPGADVAVVAAGASEVEQSLGTADVVVCATTAAEPLFDSSLLSEACVVIAVGSHEPHAREVDTALCRRAVVVVEDVATALREAGDVVLAIAEGALAAGDLVAMADVVTGRVVLPTDRPVLVKTVGMAWQDLVVARAILGGP